MVSLPRTIIKTVFVDIAKNIFFFIYKIYLNINLIIIKINIVNYNSN